MQNVNIYSAQKVIIVKEVQAFFLKQPVISPRYRLWSSSVYMTLGRSFVSGRTVLHTCSSHCKYCSPPAAVRHRYLLRHAHSMADCYGGGTTHIPFLKVSPLILTGAGLNIRNFRKFPSYLCDWNAGVPCYRLPVPSCCVLAKRWTGDLY